MSRDLYAAKPSRPINYALMSKEYPKLKSALTRAKNSNDPIKVLRAVERFLDLSAEVGCMPDDWATWRIALEDAYAVFRLSEAGDADYYEGGGPVMKQFQAAAARMDW